jgi:hypothetical protein
MLNHITSLDAVIALGAYWRQWSRASEFWRYL